MQTGRAESYSVKKKESLGGIIYEFNSGEKQSICKAYKIWLYIMQYTSLPGWCLLG